MMHKHNSVNEAPAVQSDFEQRAASSEGIYMPRHAQSGTHHNRFRKLPAIAVAAGLTLGACVARDNPHVTAETSTPVHTIARPTATETKAPITPKAETAKPYLMSHKEQQAIVAATGFEGLRSHKLHVFETFKSNDANIVVGGIDNAKQLVSTEEIKQDIRTAEVLAAKQPNFTTHIQLGPKDSADVTFDVKPSTWNLGDPDKRPTHYILFTSNNQDMAALTAPQAGFTEAFTRLAPENNMNVSIIRDLPDRDAPGRLDSNRFHVAVEAFQTSTAVVIGEKSGAILDAQKPDMSYVSKDPQNAWPALTNLGREVFNNSVAFGLESAREHVGYDQYAKTANDWPMGPYYENRMHMFAIPQRDYETIAK